MEIQKKISLILHTKRFFQAPDRIEYFHVTEVAGVTVRNRF